VQQYVSRDGWDFDGSASLLLASRILLRACPQPDSTSNPTSAQAKPPSPTSSTHCIAIQTLLDHVAAETRPHSAFRTLYNGRKSSPQTSVFEQDRSEQAFREHRQSNILYRIETRTPTPTHASAFHTGTFSSPVPDGRSSISEEPSPTHQTAGRPFLPRCRTYGSLLESSG
jgi:hypothetical protein